VLVPPALLQSFNLQSGDAITDASATLSETLEFRGRSSPAFDFLDNVSVTGAGVPDGGLTVSLLGCTLLGLAALRRKLSC
jgi:hypothetical protein